MLVLSIQGHMPVHAAAAFGETDCLKALLDNGATVADRTEWVTV